MKFVLLSQSFYDRHAVCKEILKKKDRPYCVVLLKLDNINIAIPLRSHITHRYAFFTNKETLAGLDYTKAVVVDMNKDIDCKRRGFVRKEEYKVLLGKEYIIKRGFLRFLKQYKKAIIRPELPENRYIVAVSSLQYFNDIIFDIKINKSVADE